MKNVKEGNFKNRKPYHQLQLLRFQKENFSTNGYLVNFSNYENPRPTLIVSMPQWKALRKIKSLARKNLLESAKMDQYRNKNPQHQTSNS